jgi:predicted HD phosphohydrolase
VLANHEVFQGYYYFHFLGGDRNVREIYKVMITGKNFVGCELIRYLGTQDHPYYKRAIDFCHKYDQASFDPSYPTLPLSVFMPHIRNVFSRKAYWWNPSDPKMGCVTGKENS